MKHDTSCYFPNSLYLPLKCVHRHRCPYTSMYCTDTIFTGFSRSTLSKLPLTACFSNSRLLCLQKPTAYILHCKSLITKRFKIVPSSNVIQFVLNSTISGKIGSNYALVTQETSKWRWRTGADHSPEGLTPV